MPLSAPFGSPAGAQVVVQVEQRHPVEHRLEQRLERGSAALRDDVGVAEVEADADALRADPVGEAAEDHRARGQGLRPGEHRRQVLDRDRDAEPLGAKRKGGKRAGLEQQRVLALGGVRQVAGVVDDVRGADLGRVGEQALGGAVSVASSQPETGRGVNDRLQAGGHERRRKRSRVSAERSADRESTEAGGAWT